MERVERMSLLLMVSCMFLVRVVPSTLLDGAHPPANTTTALFVLGDSSVSCGDNAFFFFLLPTDFSRLCDDGGRLRQRFIPDFIAEKLGLPPIPPFHGENGTADGVASGLSFASAPATILTSGGYAASLLSQALSQQTRQVYETLELLHLDLGPGRARRIASSALFFLSFGRDDYVDLFSGDSSGVVPKYGRQGFARVLVPQMIQAVEDLYNAGARKVAVAGVGPLGCAPRMRWERVAAADGGGRGDEYCVEEVNDLVRRYNAELSAALLDLGSRLPGLRVVFCDVYTGMMEIIANPLAYGFEDVMNACCGLGRLGGMVGCLSQQMACDEPWRRVWWDLYSPTAAMNELLANWSWSTRPICRPMTLQELASST